MKKTPSVDPGTDRPYRTFSHELKRSIVQQLEAKIVTISEVVAEHRVSRASIYKWIDKYAPKQKSHRVVVELESEQLKTHQLRDRVKELERVIGQKQLELDYLSQLLAVGSQQLGIDLKKTFGTSPSSTSESSLSNAAGR